MVVGSLRSPALVAVLMAAAGLPSLADFGYHANSNFADHDPGFPNLLLDYDCGHRSYDLSSSPREGRRACRENRGLACRDPRYPGFA
jgi:hypothetical protein